MECYVSNSTAQFVRFEASFSGVAGEGQQVHVYPEHTFQEVLGFGGAFTEAAAYTFSRMSREAQEQLAELYFGESGNRYNFCRTHIQSCDFALGNYAYVEDETDRELKTFSIRRDREYILPFIHAALEKNSGIAFLASPWSPPGFMKTNGEMNHGGRLKPEFYEMWADMVVAYVREFQKEGVNISRLTVQNEPAATQTWDSCLFTGAEEANYAVKYLRPALNRAGFSQVKINVWDHNKDIILDRVLESFSVEGARDAIDGIAFHWYTGDHFEALSQVRALFPDRELIFTEGCVEYSRYASNNHLAHAEMYAHEIIGDFNAGANAFIDWNMILDEEGGPNHVGNFCDAPVMCDPETGKIDVRLSYSYLGHFSRFVRPGARRMLVSKYHRNLECVGFLNPDGERVVILLNASNHPISYFVSENGTSVAFTQEAHSIQTLCW